MKLLMKNGKIVEQEDDHDDIVQDGETRRFLLQMMDGMPRGPPLHCPAIGSLTAGRARADHQEFFSAGELNLGALWAPYRGWG